MSTSNPPEREQYGVGSEVLKFGLKLLKPLNKGQEKVKKATEAQAVTAKAQGRAFGYGGVTVAVGGLTYSNISEDELPSLMKKAEAADMPLKIIDERINPEDYPVYKKGSDSAKAFRQAQKDAKKAGADFFKYEGRDYNTREKKAEGSLMIPPEGMPVDTYPNIPPEEMAAAKASQLPDEDMEEGYINFIMDESLADEEQEYLADVIEKDPKLSDILDKVITTASEFSGAGEVEGPGTGVSDSIPARLSDGECVFTKKATDQIGADNLQVMMDDAERAYDDGLQQFAFGGMADEEDELEDSKDYLSKTDEEIKKVMIGSNRMPSVR